MLRKLAASLTLEYADGTKAQTLLGTDFHIDTAEDTVFSLDLSGNLAARNRGLQCYAEAQAFAGSHARLSVMRINDGDVAAALCAEAEPPGPLRVELRADGGRFAYRALFAPDARGVTFSIESPVQG